MPSAPTWCGPEDNFGLLLYQLKELVREQLEVMNILDNASSDETLTVKVQLEEFEERAQQVGVSNVLPFLQSALFKDNKSASTRRTRSFSASSRTPPMQSEAVCCRSVYIGFEGYDIMTPCRQKMVICSEEQDFNLM